MPVTIAIFVNPGQRGEVAARRPWRATTGSAEYDSLGTSTRASWWMSCCRGREDLQPEPRSVQPWHLRRQLRRHRAFTVAWERPDQFRKVISHIGSFTNIRGGHVYPAAHPAGGRPADPRLPPGRIERPRQPVRELAAREPGDGSRAEVQGLRLPVRVRGRRPHAQAGRRAAARRAALVVAVTDDAGRRL